MTHDLVPRVNGVFKETDFALFCAGKHVTKYIRGSGWIVDR